VAKWSVAARIAVAKRPGRKIAHGLTRRACPLVTREGREIRMAGKEVEPRLVTGPTWRMTRAPRAAVIRRLGPDSAHVGPGSDPRAEPSLGPQLLKRLNDQAS
jgi:hypothetical protein